MVNEGEQLRNIVRWRTKRKPNRAVRLGDTLSELMEHRISPRQARFGPVAQFWDQLLPVELRRHCKIVDITGGQLRVLVDSPSYAYELRLCSSGLIKELQQQCPRAKIRKIKFIVG